MLQVKNLNMYLQKEDRLLIKDFSFSLNAGDKVVIIGEEGNGKSTLLKYLYDETLVEDYVYTTGTILKSGIFGYLPQFMDEETQQLTIQEYFQDIDIYDNYTYVESLHLNYDFLLSDQLIQTLSGGEKVKLQLFKLLCTSPDVLLLDEPSNDLDIDTLTFLETFIKECTIPIIYISHDETLITNTANTIIHIEQLIKKTQCAVTVSRLDYTSYTESRNLQFDKQTQVALKQRSDYRKKKERLQQLYEKARHNTSWINPDGIISSDGGAKKSMQTIIAKGKRFEREKEQFTDIPDREESLFINFDPSVSIPSQKRILDLSLEELKNDTKVLSKNIELSVVGNQHICIIGENGVGKSTLLKMIWEELKQRQDIKASYMPQNYQDIFDYEQTPTQFLQANYDKESLTMALTYLGSMKFTRDEMTHKISELSGGQKAKIIFLNMVLQKANVLLLDEPTRNFSPLSAPVIRNALMNFQGTIISVSHDRKYLEEVADVIYVLTKEGLKRL
ncbi:MAG: ABC-F family ATP-binding cassette domain-containing protein [Erysipelotrichales bacterium]|nr:ABC-F family ATP-binding cassette domain-containing protein [Erysipelotrichales bacterium]